MVDTPERWHERVRITFFMFSANRSYSSSTSCSRGVRSSAVAGRLVVDSESIVCVLVVTGRRMYLGRLHVREFLKWPEFRGVLLNSLSLRSWYASLIFCWYEAIERVETRV